MLNRTQLADTFIMVPPTQCQFNLQTSHDNEFQEAVHLSGDEIRNKALNEFNNMVETLIDNDIKVIKFESDNDNVETPDAVFPNNWFSTTNRGELFIFTMATENRRAEVKIEELIKKLDEHKYSVNKIIKIGDETKEQYLEGTGVVVIDHLNRNGYAASSNRCELSALNEYTALSDIEHTYTFNTKLKSGASVYHTNVMMSIGEDFVVICDEIIDKNDHKHVMSNLQHKQNVITISAAQMEKFCGNILQVKNHRSEKFIAMSTSAYQAFTPDQISILEQHGEILSFDIPIIQKVGGGGVRCMLAEIFLPLEQ